ncbi:hypothetical protein KIN20_008377 [Parelaphostrongylus tenuis]|uniref:EndoU domain-containing protein n=1 Tax=Parelaphostrongylus tenuis TaxID=148309 RepID=A0AAD5MR34_PARTN|nr:hypothetical protein KIN20_008377 [Parelaphostrongylus tenuis]
MPSSLVMKDRFAGMIPIEGVSEVLDFRWSRRYFELMGGPTLRQRLSPNLAIAFMAKLIQKNLKRTGSHSQTSDYIFLKVTIQLNGVEVQAEKHMFTHILKGCNVCKGIGVYQQVKFSWYKWNDVTTSMILNTSPEFELAVYTICALTGGECKMTIDVHNVTTAVRTVQH